MNWSRSRLRVRKLAWLAARPRWWPLLRLGIGPSIEHAEVMAGRKFQTVLDIGANVGQFALWAQEALGPQSIICVEPQRSAGEGIAAVATRSDVEITLIGSAFGAVDESRDLHITAAHDSSSILDPDTAAQDTRRELRVREAYPVAVVRGDEALRDLSLARPLLIKIDVQGSEDQVLRGMPVTLASADAVLVEVSFASLYRGQADPTDVIALLRDSGFTLVAVSGVVGGAGSTLLDQADLLFERREAGP